MEQNNNFFRKKDIFFCVEYQKLIPKDRLDQNASFYHIEVIETILCLICADILFKKF